jgi:hypothetical protein
MHQGCVTSGFRRSVNEIFVLLGCYTALIGSYLMTFIDNVSSPSSKVFFSNFEDGTDRLSRNVGK